MPLITPAVTGLPAGKRSGQSSALGRGKSSQSPAIKTTSTPGFDLHQQQTETWATRFNHHQIQFPVTTAPALSKATPATALQQIQSTTLCPATGIALRINSAQDSAPWMLEVFPR